MLLRKAVLNALYYSGVRSLAKPLVGGMGSILMLHHVCDDPEYRFFPNRHLYVSPTFLDELIEELSTEYEFISMDEVVERLENPNHNKQSKPFLTITLDDGYADNIRHAAPIFRKHKTPYMIYIAPDLVNHTSKIWWDDLERIVGNTSDKISVEFPDGVREYRVETPADKNDTYERLVKSLFFEVDELQQREIVSRLCATYGEDELGYVKEQIASWGQLKELSKDTLCTLGAHSMNHYLLSKLDDQTLRYEMEESRNVLERKIGSKVDHLAYPYGFQRAASQREFAMAKELGFRSAVTTRHGVLYEAHREHMTALPRVSINGNYQKISYMKSLLGGIPTRLENRGLALNV